PAPGFIWSLPQMPEWYLMIAMLAALTALGLLWHPFLVALPLLGLALGASLVQACLGAARASFPAAPRTGLERLARRGFLALLHLAQTLARLWGRARNGLTPWRRHSARALALPRSRIATLWSENWQSADSWLRSIVGVLRSQGAQLRQGGNFDHWDLEVH